ncbi:hypothetical protein FRC12_021736 [Ceratobasidium sp. 428]|nr:hypothetical protein FRC12_021736 [Ceratobasidium sp. 428]
MRAILGFITASILGYSWAAPAPAAPKAQCTTIRSGPLYTNQFTDATKNSVLKPYFFNSRNEVAYDPSGKSHPLINAQFQNCTPNYAQEKNLDEGQVLYGRFYIPSKNACLAVTNPSGSPPYYVGYQPCPSPADMSTKKSIPFNFVWDGTGGEIDMRWSGATILSKKFYQGPDPPASYCGGQYFVNATNLESGYNYPYLGQPNTEKQEDYRIHLYCMYRSVDQTKGTGYNSFTLPNFG